MLQLYFQNPLTRVPRRAGDKPTPGLPTASKIIDEPVSNSLIFIARAADFARIRKLVKKLDQPGAADARRGLHLIKIRHGDAEEIVQVLTPLIASTGATKRRPRGRRSRPARRLRRYLRSKKKSKRGPLFADKVQLVADKKTNSIIVAAQLADFLRLRPMVKRVDIPRRQVFVEMAILELTLNHEKRLGLAYHGGGITGTGDSQAIIFGGVQHANLGSLLLDLSSLLDAPARLPLHERVAQANLDTIGSVGVERLEAVLEDIRRDRDASYATLGVTRSAWAASASGAPAPGDGAASDDASA